MISDRRGTMNYISATQVTEKWGLSERSVRNYCSAEMITSAFLTGKARNIPVDAERSQRKNQH